MPEAKLINSVHSYKVMTQMAHYVRAEMNVWFKQSQGSILH